MLQPSDIRYYLASPSEAETELIRIFRRDEALVIFDIGSCEGEDSVRYARRFPEARIFAFEPLPENWPLVRRNFATHNLGNAELVPVALSDRAGDASFHVSAGSPKDFFAGERWNYGNKSSSLLQPAKVEAMYGWIQFDRTITVATDTLENFCSERKIDHIDFIHMDVQGAERLVLVGAGRMFRNVGAIWLEVSDSELYRGQPLRSDIRQLMRSNGFVCCHVVNREIEGDELYINSRLPRMWIYLANYYFDCQVARLRFRAGAIKSRLLLFCRSLFSSR